jgi:hypothetical protein
LIDISGQHLCADAISFSIPNGGAVIGATSLTEFNYYSVIAIIGAIVVLGLSLYLSIAQLSPVSA